MEKKLSQQEIDEQELADKITPLLKERMELDFKRGNGVTMEKNKYIGKRTSEIEAELNKLKTIKKQCQ